MNNNGHAKKDFIAAVFDRAATGYGRLSYLEPFGRQLVTFADVRPGTTVLDVATGRGAVLFPAAERVGPNGQVIGVDLSASMVQQTALEIQVRNLRNAAVLQMDAEHLLFPNATFDYILCGFSLFFFPHLQAAMSEFRRVLKPGGRLAVSTWGDDDPRWSWFDDLLTTYDAVVKLRTHMLDQANDLWAALGQAGFCEIELATQEYNWVCAHEGEWWKAQWAISQRAGLERLTPANVERLKAAAFSRLQTLKQPDGFHHQLQAHLARATKSVR